MSESTKELSGRELDAAIAEKIMLWTNVRSGCYTPIGQEWCGDDPEGTGGFYRTGRKIIPRYSERAEAAKQILEKIRQSGEFCCINIHSDHNYVWKVSLTRVESQNPAHGVAASATNESLETAICRAALAAMETKS